MGNKDEEDLSEQLGILINRVTITFFLTIYYFVYTDDGRGSWALGARYGSDTVHFGTSECEAARGPCSSWGSTLDTNQKLGGMYLVSSASF